MTVWNRLKTAANGWVSATPNKQSFNRLNVQNGSLKADSDDSGKMVRKRIIVSPDYLITREYEYYADFVKGIASNGSTDYVPDGVYGHLPHSYRHDDGVIYATQATTDGIYTYWSTDGGCSVTGSKRISYTGANPCIVVDSLGHIAVVYEVDGYITVYDERVVNTSVVSYTTTLGPGREARIVSDPDNDLVVVWYSDTAGTWGSTHRLYSWSPYQEWGIPVGGGYTIDFTPISLIPSNATRLLDVVTINRGLDRVYRHCILAIWVVRHPITGKLTLEYSQSQPLPYIVPHNDVVGVDTDIHSIELLLMQVGRTDDRLVTRVDLQSLAWLIYTSPVAYDPETLVANLDLQSIDWIMQIAGFTADTVTARVDLASISWIVYTWKYGYTTDYIGAVVSLEGITWIPNKNYSTVETMMVRIDLQSITWA